jgi:hypothetical protein
MNGVHIFGEWVVLPEGWAVVRGGPLMNGDRWTSSVLVGVSWIEVSPEWVGRDSMPNICVIRRTPVVQEAGTK